MILSWPICSKGASFPGSDVYEMVKKINDNLESSVKKIMQS